VVLDFGSNIQIKHDLYNTLLRAKLHAIFRLGEVGFFTRFFLAKTQRREGFVVELLVLAKAQRRKGFFVEFLFLTKAQRRKGAKGLL
jgi:hypothetical protein